MEVEVLKRALLQQKQRYILSLTLKLLLNDHFSQFHFNLPTYNCYISDFICDWFRVIIYRFFTHFSLPLHKADNDLRMASCTN